MPDQNLIIELRNQTTGYGPNRATVLHVTYAELFAYGPLRVEYRHPGHDNLGEYIEYDADRHKWMFRGQGFDLLNIFEFAPRETWEADGGLDVTWVDAPTSDDLHQH